MRDRAMKKTLQIVLVFAVVLAALWGAAELIQRFRPEDTAAQVPVQEEETVVNVMTPDSATQIVLAGDNASVRGTGAMVSDGTVAIAYPGTYRLSGEFDGQILVDLGEFDGAVYLILDGMSVSCGDGPALYIQKSGRTEIHLSEDTENTFRDGSDYMVQDGKDRKSGAAVFSADDLWIGGEGSLTVAGNAADGIRSQDSLTVSGGAILVYAADDGLQGSDFVDITGGDLRVYSGDDGIQTTKGYVSVSGGTQSITSGGDGIAAATELTITGGSMSVVAGGGPAYYAELAVAEISAKGLKADSIAITGGYCELNTADDAIHGNHAVELRDSVFAIATGDDAVSADELSVENVTLEISESYEGLDAETVRLTNDRLVISAANNAVSAGEGGVAAEGSELVLTAPRGISTEGILSMYGGSVMLYADGTDSLFSFAEAQIIGSTVIALAATNDASILLEKGAPDGSLLFLLRDAVPAGTEIRITDESGTLLQSMVGDTDVYAVLYANGGLLAGASCTMTAGETTLTGVPAEGCTTVEPEGGLTVQPEGGDFFMPGGFGGGPGGGPGGGGRGGRR